VGIGLGEGVIDVGVEGSVVIGEFATPGDADGTSLLPSVTGTAELIGVVLVFGGSVGV